MKISVVLPIFNVENYLENSLRSLSKSILTSEELEIIMVDDGSTDNSLTIMNEFASRDNRFCSYSKQNEGTGMARNFGLLKSSGDFVYFMDPDDEIDPNIFIKFEDQQKKFQFDVFLFGYEINFEEKKEKKCFKFNKSSRYLDSRHSISKEFIDIFSENSFFTVWNKIYRKKFLEENHLLFTNQRTGQDALFNISVFKNLETLFIYNGAYYKYTVFRNGSAQNSKHYEKLFDNLNIYKELNEYIIDNGINETYSNKYLIDTLFGYIKNKKRTYLIQEFRHYAKKIKLSGDFKTKTKYLIIKFVSLKNK